MRLDLCGFPKWDELAGVPPKRRADTKTLVSITTFSFFSDNLVKSNSRNVSRYLYEAGAVSRPEKGKFRIIDEKVINKEGNREF